MDGDGSRTADLREFSEAIRGMLSRADTEALFRAFDRGCNGKIYFDDFMRALQVFIFEFIIF